jgi:wobble nucleotide-excising tRNase
MGLKRFISIENVGRLVKCVQRGPELNRYNLLFAENGRGKTTLCAILRSLQTGRPEYIVERRTLGAQAGAPRVNIRLDAANATFQNGAWDRTVPQIAIFDATFVAQNVHAGEYVERSQRRNLLQIIVGADGVILARRVDELDAQITAKTAEIVATRRVIQGLVPRGTNLDEFLALDEDPNIDEKIATKNAELTAARRVDEIRRRVSLSTISIPSLPPQLMEILTQTVADLSAEAERRVREQVARHEMHADGEAWLAQGLGYVRDEKCPFCSQNIAGVALIEAYGQFFSAAYNHLRETIEQLRIDIEEALGSASLAMLGRALATNEASVGFWQQFAAINVQTPDHDVDTAPAIRTLCQAALALVDRKLAAPLDPIQPDNELNLALGNYVPVKEMLETYNQSVQAACNTIEAVRRATQNADTAAIQRNLTGLQLAKLRYEPEVGGNCHTLLRAMAEKKQLDEEKELAKSALDEHADQMIAGYETTINRLLAGFGAGFSITNSRKTYIGRTPTSSYQILIDDCEVDLGDSETPLGQPCFRTTLSAGDKSTLGLAFFLAQLDHDPQKAHRIVVFDDPFNSLDRSRQERTAELLKTYGAECEQLFLLSHHPVFLKLVYDKLPNADRRVLQLSRVGRNASTLEEWDIEEELKGDYFRQHAALNSFLLHGADNLRAIACAIRPVLEGYLRHRFPNRFPANEALGDMVGRIRNAGDEHPMFSSVAELEAINDYSRKYHHDTNPGRADAEPINDRELMVFAQRTLDIAGGY